MLNNECKVSCSTKQQGNFDGAQTQDCPIMMPFKHQMMFMKLAVKIGS